MATCAGCPYGTFGQRTGIQRSSVPSFYVTCLGNRDNLSTRTAAPPRGTPPLRRAEETLRDRGALFIEEAAGLVRVDRDSRGHGRSEGDLLQVPALGGGWLEPDDLVNRGRVVLKQGLLVERGLADDEVKVPVPVDAELDLAALDVGHGLGHVRRHGAGLRVRHETARTEHPAEAADLAHQVRGGHNRVEVEEPALDLLDQVVRAHVVGPGRPRGLGAVTGGEDEHASGLARAIRQVYGAADHLVLLAGVDTEPEVDLDGRVELRHLGLLRQFDRIDRAVQRVVVDLGVGVLIRLAALHSALLDGRSWS